MFAAFNARVLGLDLSASESLKLAADLGFGGVDLMVRNLVRTGEDLAVIRRALGDHGLRPGSFPMPIEWRDAGPAVFEASMATLPRLADVAAELGLSRTGTWILPWCRDSGPDTWDRTFEFHLERLGRIGEVLAARGIRLGLEVLGVETAVPAGGLPFLRRLGDPRLDQLIEALDLSAGHSEYTGRRVVGVIVDAFHLAAAAESPEVAFARGTDRVIAVHLADLPGHDRGAPIVHRDDDRGLPGESGRIDSAGILSRLAANGYDGPVIAEPFGTCRSLEGLDARGRATRAAQSLARIWPGRDGLAPRGHP